MLILIYEFSKYSSSSLVYKLLLLIYRRVPQAFLSVGVYSMEELSRLMLPVISILLLILDSLIASNVWFVILIGYYSHQNFCWGNMHLDGIKREFGLDLIFCMSSVS